MYSARFSLRAGQVRVGASAQEEATVVLLLGLRRSYIAVPPVCAAVTRQSPGQRTPVVTTHVAVAYEAAA
jgi:hypothetical protein